MEETYLILFGLIIGSFLNVVIYRLPLEEESRERRDIVKTRSYCPSCKEMIRFYDNIPVLSYIFLRGKCRYCRKHISFRYPLVEILTAFSFWMSYRYFGGNWVHTAAVILFLCVLIVLAFIDFDHMILPDELTLGGGLLFGVYAFFHPGISAWNGILTALGSALVFAGIYFFYLKARKVEGLGFGDVKMMLLLGAFLGLQKMVVTIMVASLTGTLVGIILIIARKKDLKLALPFGTFLSLGAYVAVFWGEEISAFFRSLYL